jgi:hypothetical protein
MRHSSYPALSPSATRSASPFAVTNVTLIDVATGQRQKGVTVVTRGDRIASIGRGVPIPRANSDRGFCGDDSRCVLRQKSIEHAEYASDSLLDDPFTDIRNVAQIAAVIVRGRLVTKPAIDRIVACHHRAGGAPLNDCRLSTRMWPSYYQQNATV